MDIEWISDFLELASTKNFTLAAKNRNRSQPAFSRRILGLEQWIGATLIDRSVHPFKLTTEGEIFRETAQDIMIQLHRTRDECRKNQYKSNDLIKFTALHTLAINYFAEWVADIHKNFSSIRTTMDAYNLLDCVELLQSGQSQFMLSYTTPTIPSLLNPSDFLSCRLTSDQLILVSAPNEKGKPLYRMSGKKPINYLAYYSNCLMGKMTEDIITNQCSEYTLNYIYENAITESIKAMAIAGMGICWLPKICIQGELKRGELIDVSTKALSMPLDIMLYRSSRRLSNECESLWSYVNNDE